MLHFHGRERADDFSAMGAVECPALSGRRREYDGLAGDGPNFFRIGFYVALRHNEIDDHPLRDPENTLLRVESDLEFPQLLEDGR
jgi:hypothetical protein